MKRWLTLFYGHLMRQWSWWVLILLALVIRVSVYFPNEVERYYSNGLFPWIARVQRLLLGWAPFSFGDVLYALAALALIYQVVLLVVGLIRRKLNRTKLAELLQRILFLLLLGYVGFNLLWGLNYNRPSLAERFNLDIRNPSAAELDSLAVDLIRKLDRYGAQVTPEQRDSFNRKRQLFSGAIDAYRSLAQVNPIFEYSSRSIKPSLYSYPGNYLGFQGYYNPFTGEAQVNTTIPRFLEPFVTTHEIAHQLGYAREQEANFVGVLASAHSNEPAFRYSMYFDLFLYTLGEISMQDTTRARFYHDQAPPQVLADIESYRSFIRKHRNPIERGVMWLYGEFLRANNQPNGKFTYNEVVSWVIA